MQLTRAKPGNPASVLYDQNTVITDFNLMPNYFFLILHARMLLVMSIDFSRVFLLTRYFNALAYISQTIFVLDG